ncbi:MAG TPA: hypothetical protein VGN99_09640, partial [Steroidobacteraceae bacterium]|nr:hypothetical protein [Steroidobacteraceae bacterium]
IAPALVLIADTDPERAMHSRAAIYRAKAEACSRQADLPQNTSERDRWLKLAEQWTKLARQAEHDPAGVSKHRRRRLVSRSRSSHHSAANSLASFGIQGH